MDIKKVFRDPPILQTPRLTLRKLSPRDWTDMFEYACSEEVTRYLTWEPHQNKSYTMSYLSYVQSQYRAGKFFDWAVTCSASGKMIGTCGFTTLDPQNLCGEIGYVISPVYQNRGIATEAVRRVMEFGFNELGLQRIECRFMVGNDASLKVMQKVGMIFEGIRRHSLFIKGKYVDVGVCSILSSEYKK